MHRKITKIVVTTTAGREVTVEGSGSANLVTSTTEGEPTARLEVTMPVASRLEKGENGSYVKTDVVL